MNKFQNRPNPDEAFPNLNPVPENKQLLFIPGATQSWDTLAEFFERNLR